ncbi:hypothetical protein VTH8203_02098 [Vibrio thalassae]|uniref:Uncharacterized protein n=1 Tax=Vibrio thalassae TaxID=1243014 RepID=A0A240EKJ5_9VIBR|nr:hypothetical protein [Vibrio thalassae]SNX48480.1 hypothetical protein VTH8203_02098 [Vibrio thalassae]
MVVFFCFCLSAYYLFAFPGGIHAYRRGSLSWGDAFLPLMVFAVWSVLAVLGIGAQSLGNLIEVVLLLIVAVCVFYIRLVYLHQYPNKRLTSLNIMYLVIVLLVVVTRISFPHIAE